MSQGDQFHQYGYDHYLKAPKRESSVRQSSDSFGGGGLLSSLLYSLGASTFLRKLQSPVVAGGVLAGAALLFVGVIALTYSSGSVQQGQVPVVKAEMEGFKEAPGNPGGMDIPHRQSTILAREDQPSAEAEVKGLENLLASQSHEDLVSKEEAFSEAVQKPMAGAEDGAYFSDSSVNAASSGSAEDDYSFSSAEAQDDLAALNAQSGEAVDVLSSHGSVVAVPASLSEASSASADDTGAAPALAEEAAAVAAEPAAFSADQQAQVAPAFDVEKPSESDILQKIGSTKSEAEEGDEASPYSQVFVDKTVKAALAVKPVVAAKKADEDLAALKSMANSGSASSSASSVSSVSAAPAAKVSSAKGAETIDYVRSVLDEKQGDAGAAVQNIEPALGASDGVYFVQLASISDAKRAASEWAKMQGKYPVLSSSKFRVQEAALPGGTFYRIQAGPMSKDSAAQVCDSLKQAGKPGGCLVVK